MIGKIILEYKLMLNLFSYMQIIYTEYQWNNITENHLHSLNFVSKNSVKIAMIKAAIITTAAISMARILCPMMSTRIPVKENCMYFVRPKEH